jgi:asparagine synthetase B (glutamine-hydrolysing)
MQYFYATKFLKFLQDANDRCSMANSVEARLPFCDHNVIKIALEVPMKENLKNDTEKYVLREAFKDKLPKEIYERRKSPLPANEEMKLHKLIAKELDKNIKSAPKGVWKILDKKYISELNNVFKNKIKDLEDTYGKGNGGQYLTAWLSISEEVEIRTNHVFSVLTFIRWYGMNFK